jgi:hypothetical protein
MENVAAGAAGSVEKLSVVRKSCVRAAEIYRKSGSKLPLRRISE